MTWGIDTTIEIALAALKSIAGADIYSSETVASALYELGKEAKRLQGEVLKLRANVQLVDGVVRPVPWDGGDKKLEAENTKLREWIYAHRPGDIIHDIACSLFKYSPAKKRCDCGAYDMADLGISEKDGWELVCQCEIDARISSVIDGVRRND